MAAAQPDPAVFRCDRCNTRGLCDRCTRRAAAELAELPTLWADLHDMLQPTARHGVRRTPGVSADAGLPIGILSFLGPAGRPSARNGTLQPGTEADQDGEQPLLAVLTGWADLAAEEQHVTLRSRSFGGIRSYLVRNHAWICRRQWAADYAAELHQLWRTAKSLTCSWDTPQPQTGRYCPWCDAAALYQQPGTDTYDCQERAGGCGRQMTRDEYDQMVRMSAAHHRST